MIDHYEEKSVGSALLHIPSPSVKSSQQCGETGSEGTFILLQSLLVYFASRELNLI